jgi:hypothetical protein
VNSHLADLSVHENPGKFYAKAGEMTDRIASNPLPDSKYMVVRMLATGVFRLSSMKI